MSGSAANSSAPCWALLRRGAEEPGRGNATAAAAAAECGAASVAFPACMAVAGAAGNGLALLLVCGAYRRKEHRRQRSFLLCVGALALTDLCGQLLTSPVVIWVYAAGRRWAALDPSGRLCAFFGACMTAFGLCPLFIAAAMAAERALAARAPHCYARRLSPGVTRALLLALGLAALAFALLPLLGAGRYALQWPGTWCFISPAGGPAFAAAFAALGLSALLLTVACNAATIAALLGRRRRARARWVRIATETLLQLLGVTGVLSACWAPLLIMMLKVTFNHTSMEQSCNQTQSPELQTECNFFLTAVRLASLNQILDPWVYLLLRKILLRKFCQVANAISCHSKDGWKGRHIMLSDKIRHTTA